MRRGIATLRRKVRQRVVAPVIGEAVFHEVAIVKKVVYWQEFDCRNTKTDHVLDGSRRRQPGVRTTQPFRDIRVELGESFDMEFVDNGLVPWRAWWAVISPGKSRINDHSQRGIRRIVTLIAGQIGLGVTHAVAKEFVGPAHITANRPGIGVEQDLIWIEAVSLLGGVRAIDAIAVELAGEHLRQIGMS